MTIAEALRRAQELIHSDSAKLDVELLLAEILGRDRSYLYTWPDRQLTPEQQNLFDNWFRRREAGEPVAHILGHRGFWTLELEVSPATLIPRPDTELLVETALELLADMQEPPRIIDLGTGTGAIALALASELPRAQVVATELSAEALALAERNRLSAGCGNVTLLCGDWWNGVGGRFHLVASNPPYISEDDPHLSSGDVRFEPRSALVAEDAGLADLRSIVAGAPAHLFPGGWVLLEHGWRQAETVRSLLAEAGFADIFSRRDYGGHERMSGGRWHG
ncbi:MAG: peptide chain release factor N(5)-glutamine methyltransferase [Cellvibrionaceae bacterium]|nr:peptide chain release factor N(5)-glutamine methyltransferase [Cellvibrionaceae bacterium]